MLACSASEICLSRFLIVSAEVTYSHTYEIRQALRSENKRTLLFSLLDEPLPSGVSVVADAVAERDGAGLLFDFLGVDLSAELEADSL